MFMHKTIVVFSILSTCALAGCGSSHPENASAGADNAPQAKASAPVSQASHYHAELALAGSPAVTANGEYILVAVDVTNDGPAPFGTQATAANNVHLGAHSIDTTGKILDNDLSRGDMPETKPGATGKATILLPVDKVLGHGAELLPVEEGVGWFDQWGTKPLVVGPFETCGGNAAGKVCDESGKPLPVLPAQ